MKKQKSTASLEQILKKSDDKQYVKHIDPLHVIENHVVVLLFLSLMFLTMSFVYISAPATVDSQVSGLVIDDSSYIDDNQQTSEGTNVLASIKDELGRAKEGVIYFLSYDRNYFTILSYIFCLAMIGIMISQKPHEERK